MKEILVIKHQKINDTHLNEIIKIKSVAWKYSYEEHSRWIKQNLNDDDYHVILKNNETSIAYLNLINISIYLNSTKLNGFGIGNVCAIEKRKGYGGEILQLTNNWLIDINKIGLLFCKTELVPFYQNQGWQVLKKNMYSNYLKINSIIVMIFNAQNVVTEFEYHGKMF